MKTIATNASPLGGGGSTPLTYHADLPKFSINGDQAVIRISKYEFANFLYLSGIGRTEHKSYACCRIYDRESACHEML